MKFGSVASSLGISAITTSGTITPLGVWTFRRRVAAGALGSFFLCERFAGGAAVGAEADAPAEVEDAMTRGCGAEAEGLAAARASASERWFENDFWDWRILRTAGVTLPCETVYLLATSVI